MNGLSPNLCAAFSTACENVSKQLYCGSASGSRTDIFFLVFFFQNVFLNVVNNQCQMIFCQRPQLGPLIRHFQLFINSEISCLYFNCVFLCGWLDSLENMKTAKEGQLLRRPELFYSPCSAPPRHASPFVTELDCIWIHSWNHC
mmetsp:Transcript_30828/g.49434  ORF Transcript_30828/g.49434 Transcript_30828/m.49434 type:complete len:144 (+) Transcript_30828:421-852(+)